MKHLKKLFAFLLVALLMLSLTATAFATGGDPADLGDGGDGGTTTTTAASITITSTATGGTDTTQYVAYELLKASINGNAVAYYLPSPAGDNLKTLLDAVAVNGNDLFTFTKSADGSRWNATINKKADNTEFTDTDGAAIAAALNTDAIKAAALVTKNFAQTTAGGSATTGEVDPGYYLVTSSLGTNLVLQTLKNVEIATKNEYITDVKSASKTNMEVGDTVTYTLTVHIPTSASAGDTVTVHDTLDAHLAFKADTLAAKYVQPATGDGGEATDVAVTLTDGTKKADTETFAKQFTITAGMIGKDVILTYDAELLSTAADDTGYVNTTFANDDSYETAPNEVKVWTFDFDLDKNFQNVEGDDAANYSATFYLYPTVSSTDATSGETTTTQGTTPINFITDTTGYVKIDSDDENGSPVLTVNGKDNINVRGLAQGQYYLVEQTTASGYNLLTDPIIITITDTTTGTQPDVTVSHTVSYKIGTGESATGTVTVLNQSGTVLPSTGGIGTTIFYVVGGLLVAAAVVLLITKKRVSKEG